MKNTNLKNNGIILSDNTKIGSYNNIFYDTISKNNIITNIILNENYFDLTKSKSANLHFINNQIQKVGFIDTKDAAVWADGFNVRIDIAKFIGNA